MHEKGEIILVILVVTAIVLLVIVSSMYNTYRDNAYQQLRYISTNTSILSSNIPWINFYINIRLGELIIIVVFLSLLFGKRYSLVCSLVLLLLLLLSLIYVNKLFVTIPSTLYSEYNNSYIDLLYYSTVLALFLNIAFLIYEVVIKG